MANGFVCVKRTCVREPVYVWLIKKFTPSIVDSRERIDLIVHHHRGSIAMRVPSTMMIDHHHVMSIALR